MRDSSVTCDVIITLIVAAQAGTSSLSACARRRRQLIFWLLIRCVRECVVFPSMRQVRALPPHPSARVARVRHSAQPRRCFAHAWHRGGSHFEGLGGLLPPAAGDGGQEPPEHGRVHFNNLGARPAPPPPPPAIATDGPMQAGTHGALRDAEHVRERVCVVPRVVVQRCRCHIPIARGRDDVALVGSVCSSAQRSTASELPSIWG